MRGLFIVFILCCGLLPNFVAAQEASHTVIIKNLFKKKGQVFIGWYNSEQSYMDARKAVIKRVIPVNDLDEIAVKFDKVSAGTYAIAVFFDGNGNGVLDKNFLGIPREEYGFSNNIIPLTRSATFQEASFTVSSTPETIIIGIK